MNVYSKDFVVWYAMDLWFIDPNMDIIPNPNLPVCHRRHFIINKHKNIQHDHGQFLSVETQECHIFFSSTASQENHNHTVKSVSFYFDHYLIIDRDFKKKHKSGFNVLNSVY